jgi:predicted metalloprotease
MVAACIAAAAVLLAGVVVALTLTQHPGPQAAEPAPRLPEASGAGQVLPSPSMAPPSAVPSTSRTSSPSPSFGPRKILALADHPMLQDPEAGLKNRVCNLPEWHSDQASAEAFFIAAGRCLDNAWGPFLEYYHLPFTPPALHFPTGTSFQTECGNIGVGLATAAYYCENNLYVPFRGLQTDQYGNNPGVYLALFAHEYGHHVQEVAGLMDAAWQKIYEAGPNTPVGQEMSRRKELQAQCFSGMFLGAHVERGGTVNREMYDKAWQDQETRGDNTSGSHDHGSNAHYASWWRAGARDNRIVDCNTFAASSADVS